MPHTRDVRGLRNYMLTGLIVSILMGLAGCASVILFFNPALLGIAAQHQFQYRSQSIFLFVGIGFVGFALLFVVILTRWSRRLLWIWRNTTPTPMHLLITINRSMELTSYRAILRLNANDAQDWSVRLYSPSWPVEDLQSLQHQTIQAKVYFDPHSKRPAVMETRLGLLWAMGGQSAHLKKRTL
jgi:hypothetical protein